jgi:hypothetical protein
MSGAFCRLGEEPGDFDKPFRPVVAPPIVGDRLGALADRSARRGDPVQRVGARPLQCLAPLGPSTAENLIDVARSWYGRSEPRKARDVPRVMPLARVPGYAFVAKPVVSVCRRRSAPAALRTTLHARLRDFFGDTKR